MKAQTQQQLYNSLLERCRNLEATTKAVRAENHRLREEQGRLREALEKYGGHKMANCFFDGRVCGLDEALNKADT